MVIEGCGLTDLGFAGQKFTLTNNKRVLFRVWKMLDRAMVNDKWLDVIPQTVVTHLPTVSVEHCPLLLEMTTRLDNVI